MAEVRPVRNQRQGDGSPQEWENCAAAAAADAALRARKNVKPATPYPWNSWNLPTMSSAIRKWCNQHFDTTVIKGLYQRWVNAAIKAMYGVVMGYYYDKPWSAFVATILDHRGASVSITYSYILGTQYAGFANFRGRHRWFINERKWNATKGRHEYLVYGPEHDGRRSWVPKGPIWVPASLLRKAMEASGIEVSYTPATA